MDAAERQERLFLDEYRKTVKNVLDRRDPGIVNNCSPRHAAIIVEEMVRHAKRSFSAVTGGLSPDVWTPAAMDAIREAVCRGVEVRLLVETDGGFDSVPADLLPCVRKAPPGFADLNHFAEMDGTAIRFETNRDSREAIFSAYLPQVAALACGTARRMFEKGEPRLAG